MDMTRRAFVATAGITALAGCSGSALSGVGGEETPSGISPPLRDGRLPQPGEPQALRSEAISGGPPKDGIPSIDEPSFVDPGDASNLSDGDVVFGLTRDGVAKAYPQSILVHHEICNDTAAGEPVSVTYCPLTGTAIGFQRGETTFGVSGRLINNNLIMYDRGTETWWPQVLASSIPGPWNDSPPDASLREFRLLWTTWGQWRELHPDTRVLSRDTGYARDYGSDPYGSYNPRGGYYAGGSTNFPRLNPDDRFGQKRVFIGTRTDDGAAAFLKDALREKGAISGMLGGDPIVAVYDPRLDTAYAYRNPEGANVTFEDDRPRVDGSEYDPDSLPLERVYAFDAMWFAWSGFYPDSNVYA
ncbi:MAG: DUF3179 domain-containing protein [Halobacteriales archaeon]